MLTREQWQERQLGRQEEAFRTARVAAETANCAYWAARSGKGAERQLAIHVAKLATEEAALADAQATLAALPTITSWPHLGATPE